MGAYFSRNYLGHIDFFMKTELYMRKVALSTGFQRTQCTGILQCNKAELPRYFMDLQICYNSFRKNA